LFFSKVCFAQSFITHKQYFSEFSAADQDERCRGSRSLQVLWKSSVSSGGFESTEHDSGVGNDVSFAFRIDLWVFWSTFASTSSYALMGASGCGKTTLLSCMIGMIDLDGGDIMVLGHGSKTKDIQKTGPRIGE
jgi:ABC-type multidrug transport system fused ATPase/permease subunit